MHLPRSLPDFKARLEPGKLLPVQSAIGSRNPLGCRPRRPAQFDSRRSEHVSNRSEVPTLQPRKACPVLGYAHSNLDAWSTEGTKVRVPTKPSMPSRPSAGSARPSLLF